MARSQGVNFNRLYYFHMVASLGSQAAAARQLEVSQSTISEQIKHLEESLGARLFDRAAGGMTLTDAGRRCFRHTEVMFSAGKRLVQEFESAPSDSVIVDIGVTASLSGVLAAELVLPIFARENIMPRIRFGDSQVLIRQLLSSDIDVLVTENEIEGAGARRIVSRPAVTPSLVVAASKELAERVGSFPEGLNEKPFIRHVEGSAYRWAVDTYLTRAEMVVENVGETDDAELAASLAMRGIGFVVLPEPVARRFEGENKLVIVGDLRIPCQINVSYIDESPSPSVRQAAELLTRWALETPEGQGPPSEVTWPAGPRDDLPTVAKE